MTPFCDRIESMPGMAELRARVRELLALPAGASVVDVGCGAGHALAEFVGCRAIGVDRDAEAIAAARSRLPGAEWHVGDATSLPLADGSVQGYRASRVLHLVPDPAAALAEAHRALAPGGRLALVGPDYGTVVIDGPQDVVRAANGVAREAGAGRKLRGLLLDAGFADVRVEIHTPVYTDHAVVAESLTVLADAAVRSGHVTRPDADTWLADQADRAARDRFFTAWPLFLASATRP
ncbi:methyltransferase domain-containing protein [Actinokineospora soli]